MVNFLSSSKNVKKQGETPNVIGSFNDENLNTRVGALRDNLRQNLPNLLVRDGKVHLNPVIPLRITTGSNGVPHGINSDPDNSADARIKANIKLCSRKMPDTTLSRIELILGEKVDDIDGAIKLIIEANKHVKYEYGKEVLDDLLKICVAKKLLQEPDKAMLDWKNTVKMSDSDFKSMVIKLIDGVRLFQTRFLKIKYSEGNIKELILDLKFYITDHYEKEKAQFSMFRMNGLKFKNLDAPEFNEVHEYYGSYQKRDVKLAADWIVKCSSELEAAIKKGATNRKAMVEKIEDMLKEYLKENIPSWNSLEKLNVKFQQLGTKSKGNIGGIRGTGMTASQAYGSSFRGEFQFKEFLKSLDGDEKYLGKLLMSAVLRFHPFKDGNGRVARFLYAAKAIKAGNFVPLKYGIPAKLAHFDDKQESIQYGAKRGLFVGNVDRKIAKFKGNKNWARFYGDKFIDLVAKSQNMEIKIIKKDDAGELEVSKHNSISIKDNKNNNKKITLYYDKEKKRYCPVENAPGSVKGPTLRSLTIGAPLGDIDSEEDNGFFDYLGSFSGKSATKVRDEFIEQVDSCFKDNGWKFNNLQVNNWLRIYLKDEYGNEDPYFEKVSAFLSSMYNTIDEITRDIVSDSAVPNIEENVNRLLEIKPVDGYSTVETIDMLITALKIKIDEINKGPLAFPTLPRSGQGFKKTKNDAGFEKAMRHLQVLAHQLEENILSISEGSDVRSTIAEVDGPTFGLNPHLGQARTETNDNASEIGQVGTAKTYFYGKGFQNYNINKNI